MRSNQLALRLARPFGGLFDSFFTDTLPEVFPGAAAPATNIAETTDNLILSFELPGVEEKDIQLDIHEGSLTVSAERRDERTEGNGTTWHRVEQRTGQWSRTLVLPESVNPEAVTAVYRNGVLTVTIQKHPKSKPVRVQIKGS
jgi:HSP20 family protein